MRPPKADDAKKLARIYGATGVVILSINTCRVAGAIGGASYGRTEGACGAMGNLLDEIMDKLENEELVIHT